MAAELNARLNKSQTTIAFTLPISCQVCLGKVKSPALCPNNHVFCSTCLDVWLQKNKHCPACRVSMTSPKKIMGGVHHQEHDSDKLTNPELRKARFDLLYKEYEMIQMSTHNIDFGFEIIRTDSDKLTNTDLRKARFDLLYKEYENEFERMQSEIHLLKTENQILKQQTRKDALTESRPGHGESSKSSEQLLVLTKKLQDATKLYEKMKTELSRVKQENTNLKDENVSLNRENQNLRQELAGRSPHRYGRITVQTLESKLASAEKDVTRLTKALERSDKYIEELETERDNYKGRSSSTKTDRYSLNGDVLGSKSSESSEYGIRGDNASRRQLFSEEKGGKSASGERSKYYYDRNGDDRATDLREDYMDYDSHSDKRVGKVPSAKTNGSNGGKKRVIFDLNKNTETTAVSFELEMPSPVKARNTAGNRSASPVKGVLKKGGDKQNGVTNNYDGYTSDLSKTLEEDSLAGSYNRKPSDRFSKDDDLLYRKGKTLSGDRDYNRTETAVSTGRKKYSADDSVLSQPSDLDCKSYEDLDYVKKSSKDYNLGSGDREYRSSQSLRSKVRQDDLDRSDLDDTNYIESELDELNISLTPEFTDCMKLLNRAEKKVQGTSDSELDDLPSSSSYKSTRESDLDAAFRASTGSIGYRGGGNDNFKPETDRFASSLDSYSRGRHVRSGSLDNILLPSEHSNTDLTSDLNYRPSSALPMTSNMYPPTSQSKYSSGLTTGRTTTLTRTPSLDNLLMTRPSTGYQNKYTPISTAGRAGLVPGYKPYSENNDQIDVNSTGAGTIASSGTQPFPAKHGILNPGGGLGREGEDRGSYDAVLQARARTLADYTGSTSGGGLEDKKSLTTGRLTPTLPGSSTSTGRLTPTLPGSSTGSDLDYRYSTGRDYLSDHNTKSGMGSGRSTPTLTSNTDLNSHTRPQFSDYKYMGTDLSLKPPTGSRPSDLGQGQTGSARSSNTNYTNPAPSYSNTYSASSSDSQGYSGMPNYTSHTNVGNGLISGGGSSSSINVVGSDGGTGGGMFYDGTKYEGRPMSLSANSKMAGDNFEMNNNKIDFTSSNGNYRSSNFDDKNYLSTNAAGSSSVSSSYKDYNYRDGTDFSNFSTKVGSSNLPLPVPSSSTVNVSSGSFAGSMYGLGASSSSSSSSYTSSSYMPATFSGGSSIPSYSTAHSVPFTYTSSSYTSSAPVSSYTTKTLDPIAESSNHYSYVSNASGDFSSKNDTLALPEPKKRLFDNSEELDMSVSPIKANRRF